MEGIYQTSDMTSVRIVLILAPLWLLALLLMRIRRSPTAGLCCYANKPRQGLGRSTVRGGKGLKTGFGDNRDVCGALLSSYSTGSCHQVIQISIGIWQVELFFFFSVFLLDNIFHGISLPS